MTLFCFSYDFTKWTIITLCAVLAVNVIGLAVLFLK